MNDQGIYLLHGAQSFYYPDGQFQWRVRFENGLKVGLESYYRHDGSLEWQWQHNDQGPSEFTVFDHSGKKKAVSQWKDKKLLNYQIL